VPRPGRIISPAEMPPPRSGLSRAAFLLTGLAVGLLAGLLLALRRERTSDLVSGPTDVERAGLPVVAVFPRRRLFGGVDDEQADEAVRRLRAAVLASRHQPPVVAVSPCAPDLDEPGLTARLAVSLCRAGIEVVLVDAADGGLDPGGIFPDGETPGLAEALLRPHLDVRSLLVHVEPRLRVLTRGQLFEEAADHFLPHHLERVLRPLSDEAEVVVVRAPSVRRSAGEAVSVVAGGTVLVVVPQSTTTTDVSVSVSLLSRAGRVLVGGVVSPRTAHGTGPRVAGGEHRVATERVEAQDEAVRAGRAS
jgi:hypothetical protein